MDNKKKLNIGKYKIELDVPNQSIDLKYSKVNNIDVYDEEGRILWNISKLLKAYSYENGIQYYEELFYDIFPLGNNKMVCRGFCNHCEIDLNTEKIVKIVNNR